MSLYTRFDYIPDISRGSLRQVFIDEAGLTQAKSCDIYLADYNDLDGIIEQLQQLMPGLNVVEWLSQTVEYTQTQSEIYRTAITEFFEKLPEFVDSFKTKEIKASLNIGSLTGKDAKLFSWACKEVVATIGWSKQGQTWKRVNTEDYFAD